MPEVCPYCNDPIESVRPESGDEPAHELWRCEACGEEWRHPTETVLDRNLDFSESGEQLSRRDSGICSSW